MVKRFLQREYQRVTITVFGKSVLIFEDRQGLFMYAAVLVLVLVLVSVSRVCSPYFRCLFEFGWLDAIFLHCD